MTTTELRRLLRLIRIKVKEVKGGLLTNKALAEVLEQLVMEIDEGESGTSYDFLNGLTELNGEVNLGGSYEGYVQIGDHTVQSYITLGNDIAFFGNNGAGFTAFNGDVAMSYTDLDFNTQQFHMSAEGITFTDTLFEKGAGDWGDYSANKTAYSYITKQMLEDALPEDIYVKRSGDTMTGNLTFGFDDNTGGNINPDAGVGLFFNNGFTDYGAVYYESTGDQNESSNLIIETGDNNPDSPLGANEGIIFRHWNGEIGQIAENYLRLTPRKFVYRNQNVVRSVNGIEADIEGNVYVDTVQEGDYIIADPVFAQDADIWLQGSVTAIDVRASDSVYTPSFNLLGGDGESTWTIRNKAQAFAVSNFGGSETKFAVDNAFTYLYNALNIVGPTGRGSIISSIDENELPGQGGTAVSLNFNSNEHEASIRYQPGATEVKRLSVFVDGGAIQERIAYLSDIVTGGDVYTSGGPGARNYITKETEFANSLIINGAPYATENFNLVGTNVSDGKVYRIDPALFSGGSSYEFENGLNESLGVVGLGGSLNEGATIIGGGTQPTMIFGNGVNKSLLSILGDGIGNGALTSLDILAEDGSYNALFGVQTDAGGSPITLNINTLTGARFRDDLLSRGAGDADDYSATKQALDYITKQMLEDALAGVGGGGTTYAFTNGLSESGGTAKLGGPLLNAVTRIGTFNAMELAFLRDGNTGENNDFIIRNKRPSGNESFLYLGGAGGGYNGWELKSQNGSRLNSTNAGVFLDDSYGFKYNNDTIAAKTFPADNFWVPPAKWSLDKYKSDVYTPTLSIVQNGSSPSAQGFRYMKIDNTVFVTGYVQVTIPTAALGGGVRISLPIASDLTAFGDVTGVSTENFGEVQNTVEADTTANTATIYYNIPTGKTLGSRNFNVSFSYTIK